MAPACSVQASRTATLRIVHMAYAF